MASPNRFERLAYCLGGSRFPTLFRHGINSALSGTASFARDQFALMTCVHFIPQVMRSLAIQFLIFISLKVKVNSIVSAGLFSIAGDKFF